MNHTPRRHRAVLAVVLALVAALAGCSTPKPTPAVIGLTYIPNIQFAPFYVADHQGFAAPVPVSLRHHGVSEGLFTALAAGDEQFVVAGGDEILQARTQGVDVVAVASYYAAYPARLIVPAGSAITDVAGLKGHSVGIPGRFGENWFALLIALREAGLTESDVTITEIGYTQQAALTTGQVDAVVGFANSDVIAFREAGVGVESYDLGVPLVSICLATTGTYAAAHPDVVRAVVAAMRTGMTTAANDPAGTLDIAATYIPAFTGATRTTAEQVLPATTALFTKAGVLSPPFDPAQWAAMAQAMGAAGLIPAGTDPAPAYSNAYNGA